MFGGFASPSAGVSWRRRQRRSRVHRTKDRRFEPLELRTVLSVGFLPALSDPAVALDAAAAPLLAYLKIDGIDGESTDAKHPDWITVLGYSESVTHPNSVLTRGVVMGRPAFGDFQIVKPVDKTTPTLFLDAATGKHLKSAILEVVEPGGSVLDYKLSDVVITSVSDQGNAGDSTPLEQFSLNFSKIEWDYAAVNADGALQTPVTTGWDLKNNKAQVSSASVAGLPALSPSPQAIASGGAFAAYLKLDGVDGTSVNEKHKDWIEVLGFSGGLSQTAFSGRGGAGAGKVSLSDLSVVKTVDKTTPLLLIDSASGKHIKSAILEVVEPDGSVLDYKLYDVVIRAVNDSGNAGGSAPLEQVSLNFSKIEWDFAAVNPEGALPVTTSWDLKTHKSQVSSTGLADLVAQLASQPPPGSEGSFTAYLKLDGVDGTSVNEKHKDWIEVLGFSGGLSQTAASAGGGGGAGKASLSDLSVVKTVDKTTPLLFLDSASGKHLKSAILEVVEPDGSVLDYKLSDVVIRAVNDSGNAGGSAPLEQVSLNFSKIEWDFAAANSDGALPVTTSWDLKTHRSQVSGTGLADLVAQLASQPPPGREGSFTAYLKLDGVDGTSVNEKHKDWIEVLGFSGGLSQTAASAGGGGGAGKVSLSDLSVVKTVDKTTPLLFLDSASGKHLKSAILEVVEPDGAVLDYKLSDVVVSSVSDRSAAGNSTPLEQVSLNFSKVEWDFAAANSDGALPVTTRWDLKTHKSQVSSTGLADLVAQLASQPPPGSEGSFTAYLKLDGVDGTSVNEKHKDWIEVLGFSGGLSQTAASAGGGGGAGKASLSDLSVVKTVDKTTPLLFLDSASGKHIKSAILEVVEPDGSVLDYKLSDVVIRAVNDSGNAGGSAPLEQVSLNFSKIEWDFAAANSDGALPVTTSWDLKTHKSQVSGTGLADLVAQLASQPPPGSEGSFTAYLKLDGVDGTSANEKHKDWIEVLGFSGGLSQTAASAGGGGAGAGKVSLSDLSVVKTVDKTTPLLFLDSASGKHLKSAILEVVEPDGSVLDYKLSDVVISSVSDRSAAGNSTPLEQVSLNFSKIEWDFAAANSDGALPVTTSWAAKSRSTYNPWAAMLAGDSAFSAKKTAADFLFADPALPWLSS